MYDTPSFTPRGLCLTSDTDTPVQKGTSPVRGTSLRTFVSGPGSYTRLTLTHTLEQVRESRRHRREVGGFAQRRGTREERKLRFLLRKRNGDGLTYQRLSPLQTSTMVSKYRSSIVYQVSVTPLSNHQGGHQYPLLPSASALPSFALLPSEPFRLRSLLFERFKTNPSKVYEELLK